MALSGSQVILCLLRYFGSPASSLHCLAPSESSEGVAAISSYRLVSRLFNLGWPLDLLLLCLPSDYQRVEGFGFGVLLLV